MAKQFHFDDEDDVQDEYQSFSYLDDLENKKEDPASHRSLLHN